VVAHHGVDRALKSLVPTSDHVAHPDVALLVAQPLELAVGVEHEHRAAGPSGVTRRLGMQTDDEVRDAEQAEPEVVVGRVGGHVAVPLCPVLPGEPAQLSPEQPLEVLLVDNGGASEDRHE